MCAYLHYMIDNASKVDVEDVQKVSLLRHIKEQLIVLNIITLNRLIWVEMLLDFIDTFL